MGHSGYRSKADKRKKQRTPHEKSRRARTSRMRLRRKELGLKFVQFQDAEGNFHQALQRRPS